MVGRVSGLKTPSTKLQGSYGQGIDNRVLRCHSLHFDTASDAELVLEIVRPLHAETNIVLSLVLKNVNGE